MPPGLALGASALALAGLVATLARLPGRHCALAALAAGEDGLRARLAGSGAFLPASWTRRSRAGAAVALVEIEAGGRRYGWLLARGSLPDDDFRRLKARIRLSC